VEGAILGDAGIVDEHVDRTEVCLDLLDAGGTGVERTDIPFVNGNTGLGLELLRRRVIAGIARRNFVARGLSDLLIAAPMPLVPPVTNATRAMSYPPLDGLLGKPELPRSFDEACSSSPARLPHAKTHHR